MYVFQEHKQCIYPIHVHNTKLDVGNSSECSVNRQCTEGKSGKMETILKFLTVHTPGYTGWLSHMFISTACVNNCFR